MTHPLPLAVLTLPLLRRRGVGGAVRDEDARGVRTDEDAVVVARVEGERPDATARQGRVEPLPRHPRVGRAEDAAAFELAEDAPAALVSVAYEDLVGVVGVNEHAREAAQREVAAAALPVLARVVRDVERLRRADVDVLGPLRVALDDVDWRVRGDVAHLLPGLAAVA